MQKLLPLFLKIIGVTLVIVGLIAVYYGPLEIFVFYFFSKGGQFHYDGFGIGSLWYASLVVQNLGYYLIAALCLPVGIGHLRLRRWSLTLTHLYLWFWLGAGILLFGNGIFLVPAAFKLEISRDVLVFRITAIGISAFIFLILLPVLALWFYRNKMVKSVFEAHDPNLYWTERYPFTLLALLFLFVIMIIALHLAIFFQGIFPLFGQIMLGRQPAYLIALCVLILVVLIYGIVQLKRWAWWGSLVFVSALAISSLLSFSQHSFYEIILVMDLPAIEMEFLEKVNLLHNFHLAGLIAVPLLAALGLIIYSKRFFERI